MCFSPPHSFEPEVLINLKRALALEKASTPSKTLSDLEALATFNLQSPQDSGHQLPERNPDQ